MTAGSHRRSPRRVFRWPLAIGVASAIGLVAALVGDGAYDVIAWVTLAIPVLVSLSGLRKRAR